MPPSIQKKHDPSCEDTSRPLCIAAQQGDGVAMARLLAAGADPNASVAARTPLGEAFNSTALFVAAGHGRLEATQLLLDAGADPSRAGSSGTTPLIIAAINGHPEVLRLLLARGAAVDAVEPRGGRTAFHVTVCPSDGPLSLQVL
jgi:ankyrin repeat protein